MVKDVYIKGIDSRDTIRNTEDGYCDVIENLRPMGTKEALHWEPIKNAQGVTLGATGSKGYLEFLITGVGNILNNVDYTLSVTFSGNTVSKDYYGQNLYSIITLMVIELNGSILFNTNYTATYETINTDQYSIKIETNSIGDTFNGVEFDVAFIGGSNILAFGGVNDANTFTISKGLSITIEEPIYSFWQKRTAFGTMTTNYSASLNRLVVVYPDRISIFDEDSPNVFIQSIESYLLEVSNPKIYNHSTIDEANVFSVNSDETPTLLIAIVDDAIFELDYPQLPKVKITNEEVTGEDFLSDGWYGFRYALLFSDGTPIKISNVIPIRIENTVGKTTKLKFEHDGVVFYNSNDLFWAKNLIGIGLYLTPKVSTAMQTAQPLVRKEDAYAEMFNSVFYKIGEIKNEKKAAYTFAEKNEVIPTRATLIVDLINSNHRIFSRITGSYNKRIILGGLATDFSTPVFRKPLVTISFNDTYSGADAATFPFNAEYKLVVKIETDNGIFYRESNSAFSNLQKPEFEFNSFQYPDRRATQMFLYSKHEGNEFPEEFYMVGEFILKPSLSMNISWVYLTGFYANGYLPTIKPFPDFSSLSYDSRKFALSDATNPYIFKGANVYRVGQYSNEVIQGFSANALPVSTGQFGEYPLYVFTNKTIWAMQQSQDASVVFSSIQPISLTEGALNPRAITNQDQLIIFASFQGVFFLAEGRTTLISQPINDVIDWSEICNDVTLFHFQDNNVSEIWICTPSKTYVLNIEKSAWYSFSRVRKLLFDGIGNQLYSIDANGEIQKEIGPGVEPYQIISKPIKLGTLDIHKKLKALFIRAEMNTPQLVVGFISNNKTLNEAEVYNGNVLTVRTNYGSAYAYRVYLSDATPNSEDSIDVMQFEFEQRYTHKIRN